MCNHIFVLRYESAAGTLCYNQAAALQLRKGLLHRVGIYAGFSGQFPDTVKEVVFDRKYGVQFEPVSNGTIYDQPIDSAVLAAKLCLEGANTAGKSLYFFAPALSAGSWIRSSRTYCTTIGCHRFYL